MNVSTDTRDGYAVVTITGRLTASGAPLLRNAVSDLVDAGQPRIAIDLQGVDNALGRSSVEINQGNLRSVNVAQAGGRTRRVINI